MKDFVTCRAVGGRVNHVFVLRAATDLQTTLCGKSLLPSRHYAPLVGFVYHRAYLDRPCAKCQTCLQAIRDKQSP
jgi:hypothetical protein